MLTSRRASSAGSPSLKKRRPAAGLSSSLQNHGKRSSTKIRIDDDEEDYEDEEEVEGEEDSEGYEDLNSSSNLVRHKVSEGGNNKSRLRRSSTTAITTTITTPVGSRTRWSSVTSNAISAYRRHHHQLGRGGRGSISTLHRAISIQSLDFLHTIDTVLGEDLEDEDFGEAIVEEELGRPRYAHRRPISSIRPHEYSHLSLRYCQIHSATAAAALAANATKSRLTGDAVATTAAAETLAKINRKEKMG
ncbi:hypothetical protein BG015_000926 [Linnemannia schmuckeri]|uniref:Uncharacterized protein n=1 Tax=Linnemannia schmuckeri TaxID=64567 RepID=A0A9P5VE46_9FUNG|nr:hypothetical protein BG015_000926 [Linnemannia schmuckeri]